MVEYDKIDKADWIRLQADLPTSPKIMALGSEPDSAALKWLWVSIMCLAASIGRAGALIVGTRPIDASYIAAFAGVDVDVVDKGIELFAELEMIARDDNGVLNVRNYAKYQRPLVAAAKKREADRERVAAKRAAARQSVDDAPAADPETTKPKKQPKVYDHESEPYISALYLADTIAQWHPAIRRSEQRLQSWAADIDKMHRIDGVPWRRVEAMLDFAAHDAFWSTVVLSGAKLRAQCDQLYAKAAAGGFRPADWCPGYKFDLFEYEEEQ